MEDLYGFASADIDQIRKIIEPVLGIEMDAHESSYRCGDYYLKRLENGDNISLQKNHDRVRDEWRFDEYKSMGSLLFVYSKEQSRVEAIRLRLAAVQVAIHLQRTTSGEGGKLVIERVYQALE